MELDKTQKEIAIQELFQEKLKTLAEKYTPKNKRKLYIYLHEWLAESNFPEERQANSILLQRLQENHKKDQKISELEFGVYLNELFQQVSKSIEQDDMSPKPESFIVHLLDLEEFLELRRTYDKRSDEYKRVLKEFIAKYDSI